MCFPQFVTDDKKDGAKRIILHKREKLKIIEIRAINRQKSLDIRAPKCYNMLYVFGVLFCLCAINAKIDTLAGTLPADVYKQYH